MANQNGSAPQYREQVEYYKKHVDENENVPDHKEHHCGVGACQPRCMQPCANIKIFGLLLGLQIIAFMSYGTYYLGTVRTLERRFGFSSQEVGLLSSSSDIIQTCVLIYIGYLGSKLNKARMLSSLLIFSCLGMLLTSLPYFIYGRFEYDSTTGTSSSPDPTSSPDQQASTVRGGNYQVCSSDNSSSQCSASDEILARHNKITYNIYLAAFLLIGLGTSGLSTIGLSFLDENVKKEKSTDCMGIVGSMYAVGPMIGFGFASATTSLPEDLTDDQGLDSRDPNFIGCWWLGGVVFASLTLIIIVLMFFFPKHLPDYYKYHKPTKKTKSSSADNPDESACMREVKLFFRAFARLACNPAYVLLMCSNIAAMYIAVGLLVNLTRYLEVHFRLPAFIANIAAALCGALTSAVGGILAGIVMKRRKLQPPAYATIIVVVKVIVTISLVILMFLSCAQPDIQGETSDSKVVKVDTMCPNCQCNRDRYQAVCPQDSDKLYFSPCHAGCTINNNGSYSDCTCAADGPDIILKAEYCSSTCITVYPYLVILGLALFVGAFSRPPATVLVFRIVDPELKAFALGIQGTLYNLLVFIPGPLIFGTLFDSSCRLWQQTCGERGSCLLYDGDRFRFLLHGVVLAFTFIALLFSIGLCIVMRRRDYGDKMDDVDVRDNGYINENDESTDM